MGISIRGNAKKQHLLSRVMECIFGVLVRCIKGFLYKVNLMVKDEKLKKLDKCTKETLLMERLKAMVKLY